GKVRFAGRASPRAGDLGSGVAETSETAETHRPLGESHESHARRLAKNPYGIGIRASESPVSPKLSTPAPPIRRPQRSRGKAPASVRRRGSKIIVRFYGTAGDRPIMGNGFVHSGEKQGPQSRSIAHNESRASDLPTGRLRCSMT